jgi:hypothetical protein
VLVQQIDLADGVEDGATRPAKKDAPLCASCGKFINPRRPACIYCGAEIPKQAPPEKKEPPVQLVACGGCGRAVNARHTVYTEKGLRCDECYRP